MHFHLLLFHTRLLLLWQVSLHPCQTQFRNRSRRVILTWRLNMHSVRRRSGVQIVERRKGEINSNAVTLHHWRISNRIWCVLLVYAIISTRLPSKTCVDFNIKYHIYSWLLIIDWRSVWFSQCLMMSYIKCNYVIFHLIIYGILPKRVPILLV